MFTMFEVYRIKRSGPRIEPCGTPKRTEKIFDEEPLSLTLWDLRARNEEIHCKAEAVIPNCSWRTLRRMELSTQSKAAEKSSSSRAVEKPKSRAMTMSLYTLMPDCCFRGVMLTKVRLRGWKQM